MQPVKRIKEEYSSDGEVQIPSEDPLTVGDSDFEDVYIPHAGRDRNAASDAESQADFEEDEADESDGGLHALVSRAKQARAGRGKWDADAKRARWNEKYGAMKAEEAVGACFCLLGRWVKLTGCPQPSCTRNGAPPPTITSSIRRL